MTTTGPFPTSPVAERLRASVPAFNVVGEAASVALAQAGQAPAPCAYVVLGTEQGGQRLGGSVAYRQRVAATVGVLIGVRVYGDEAGGAAAPELVDLTRATRAALLGWKPAGAETAFEFADARLLAMDENATVWWLERFRCDYWING